MYGTFKLAKDPTIGSRPVKRRKTRLWVLAAILLLLSPAAWAVITVLTAEPAPNPVYEQKLRDLAAAQQRDPSARNRHADLVAALDDFWNEQWDISQRTLDDRRSQDPDNSLIPYGLDFYAPLSEPEFSKQRHLIEVEIANSVIKEMETRNLAKPIFDILKHANLGNDYAVTDPHPERYTPLWFRWHDEVGHLRNLTSFQVMRSRIQAEAGEHLAAARILHETSLIPQYLSRQASMVEYLTALACCETILTEVARIATTEDTDEQTLSVLSQALTQAQDLGDFTVALEGDLIQMNDSLYALHSASGRVIPSSGSYLHDERAYYPSPPIRHQPTIAERFGDIIGFAMASRDENIEFARQATDMMLPALKTRDVDARKQILRDYDLFTSARAEHLPLSGKAMREGPPKCVHAFWRTQSQFVMTRTILAMAEYRLDTGDWPESLDHLVPDYLDAIPINPVTGDPFEYDHTPGKAPTLEHFGVLGM